MGRAGFSLEIELNMNKTLHQHWYIGINKAKFDCIGVFQGAFVKTSFTRFCFSHVKEKVFVFITNYFLLYNDLQKQFDISIWCGSTWRSVLQSALSSRLIISRTCYIKTAFEQV